MLSIMRQAMARKRPNPLRILVTEHGGSHEEVYSALIYTFGRLPHAIVYPYLLLPRFNITAVLSSFGFGNIGYPRFSGDLKIDSTDAKGGLEAPDIVVSTTCELDLSGLKDQYSRMLSRGSYLFCTVHHADRWTKDHSSGAYEAVAPWIDAGKVTFLFLSPHTRGFMTKWALPTWDKKHRMVRGKFEVFVPVYPVPSAEIGATSWDTDAHEFNVSVQGNYESSRRDYKTLFEHLERENSESKEKSTDNKEAKIRLHLIGSGKRPQVPNEVDEQVTFDDSLSFLDFYRVLAGSVAILPAFANDEYYYHKASSSVPASLIAGTPLVGPRRLEDTYAYLKGKGGKLHTIWAQKKKETEMDVVERILKGGKEGISGRKATVRRVRDELLVENYDKVEWMTGVVPYKVDRLQSDADPRAGWRWKW
ncbi:uncharacterized protein V1516DRAFT_3799 [Lipomyces oligophaga]|uniref:uncharacterized protein n=1 Tax=Lipomyces oligophaga TaxID=45792 RepID=UPI0034CE0FC9